MPLVFNFLLSSKKLSKKRLQTKISPSKGVVLFATVITALQLLGCTLDAPYHDGFPPTEANFSGYIGGDESQQPSYYKNTSYDLAFVEFDEKGDFWDRQQLGVAIKNLKTVKVVTGKPPLLLIYIHGWQNNSSDKTHDVASFKGLLQRLANNPSVSQNYHVSGVYLGWRGLLVPPGGDPISQAVLFTPHETSFWSRKDAATRVAGEPMSETIFSLVHAARTTEGARTVLIGHSFGALILEKTLAQALPASFYTQDDPGKNYTPPADMILLLSSAAESIYAKEVVDMFRRFRFEQGITPARPLILSVTSQADWATGTLFPMGTSLSNVFGTFRTYQQNKKYDGVDQKVDQNVYFTTTPGWNKNLISHNVVCLNPTELAKASNPNGSQDVASNLDPAFNRNLSQHEAPLTEFLTEPEGHQIHWKIQPVPGYKQTPYWIITVPKEIIPDHSGIWYDSSLDLVAALYNLATAEQGEGIRNATVSTVK